MNTFIKHTALLALVGTTCFAAPSHNSLYNEGKKSARRLIELLNCTDEKKAQELGLKNAQFISHEFIDVSNVLQKEKLGSPAYQQAFDGLKAYYRGQKEVLQGYTLPECSANEQKEAVISFVMSNADNTLTSANHFEATKKMGELVSHKIEANKQEFPQLPKLESFEADPQHAFYKEGYALGKNSYELIILQAQGKDIPAEKQLALSTRTTEFMQKEFGKLSAEDESQYPEIAQNIMQFLVGIEKSINEFPLEATFKKHNTSKMHADNIRLSMKLLNQMVSSMKQMFLEGDPSKLSQLGTSLQEFGKAGAELAKS